MYFEPPVQPVLEDLLLVLRQRFDRPNPEFVRLLRLMFSKIHEESHAGFSNLMIYADKFFDELVVVFDRLSAELTESNSNLDTWYYHAMIDCITSAHQPQVLKLLWRELHHIHPAARSLAIARLGEKGAHDKEARKILQNARKWELATPEATREFRRLIDEAL